MSDLFKEKRGRLDQLKSFYSIIKNSDIRGEPSDLKEQIGNTVITEADEPVDDLEVMDAVPEDAPQVGALVGATSKESLILQIESYLGGGTYESVVGKSDLANPESHSFRYLSLVTAINSILRDQGRVVRRLDSGRMEVLRRIKELSKEVNEEFLINNPPPEQESAVTQGVQSDVPEANAIEDEDWAYYAAISPEKERVARWWLENATTISGVSSTSYSEWSRWAEQNDISDSTDSDTILSKLEQAVSSDQVSSSQTINLAGARIASEMETSQEGIERLRGAEGFRAHVYDDHNGEEVRSYDEIGTGNPTIGYGHLIRDSERDRFSRNLLGATPMTAQQAEDLFIEDIRKHEVPWKNQINAPLTQVMFDALTSYAFNVGGGGPRRDGIVDQLNKVDAEGNPAPDYAAAAEAIRNGPQRSNGRLLQGLVRRRNREADEFLSGISEISSPAATVASISPGTALLVGDSQMVGAIGDYIEQAVRSAGYNISGRLAQVSTTPGHWASDSGFLEQLSQGPELIAISLGGNGIGRDGGGARQLFDVISNTSPDSKIVWSGAPPATQIAGNPSWHPESLVSEEGAETLNSDVRMPINDTIESIVGSSNFFRPAEYTPCTKTHDGIHVPSCAAPIAMAELSIPSPSAEAAPVVASKRLSILSNLYKQSKNNTRGLGDNDMYKNVDTIKNFGDPNKSEDRKKLETMMADVGLKSLDELSRKERSSFVKAVLGESEKKTKKKKRSKDSARNRRRRVTSPFRSNFDYGERERRPKEDE